MSAKEAVSLFKEVKNGGINAFLIICTVLFMGFVTFKAEQRLDKQTTIMAQEREQNNKILKEISESTRAISESQKEMSIMYKMYENRLGRIESMVYWNGENIRTIQQKLDIQIVPINYNQQ